MAGRNLTPSSAPQVGQAVFEPFSTGQGLYEAQPTGMVGIDQRAPGLGEDFANQAVGFYAGGGAPATTQNQQTVFGQYMATPAEAGLDPYYDNAIRQSREDIDAMSASRGAYGSSAALGLGAEAATNLRAEQANREADFGLRRLQLGGSLAAGADAGSLAASADERAWTMGLGDLAFAGQDATRRRGQDYFNNQMMMGGTIEGLMADEYGAMFADDRALMDAAFMSEMGQLSEAQAAAYRAELQKAQEDAAEREFAMDVATIPINYGMGFAD